MRIFAVLFLLFAVGCSQKEEVNGAVGTKGIDPPVVVGGVAAEGIKMRFLCETPEGVKVYRVFDGYERVYIVVDKDGHGRIRSER